MSDWQVGKSCGCCDIKVSLCTKCMRTYPISEGHTMCVDCWIDAQNKYKAWQCFSWDGGLHFMIFDRYCLYCDFLADVIWFFRAKRYNGKDWDFEYVELK